jgi:hypothetical protein
VAAGAGSGETLDARSSGLLKRPEENLCSPFLGHSFASRLLKTKEWHPKIIHNSSALWIT